MLVKLVYKDNTDILSGIEFVSINHEEGENKTLTVVFKDEKPRINFTLSEIKENVEVNLCEAFLMNDRGETIERLN